MRLSNFELQELACAMMKFSEEETEDAFNNDEIDYLFYEKYKFDLSYMYDVISDLIRLTPIIESAITKEKFYAFIKDGNAIVKERCEL